MLIEAAVGQPQKRDVRFVTTYLGLELANPLVASAGPLSQSVEGVQALEDAGVGAIVMYSLFEEQLRHEQARDEALEEHLNESYAESLTYFPSVPTTNNGLSGRYLSLLERAASAVKVPLIASLNGSTVGSWVEIARQLQDAGAAALELNIYFVPGDVTTTGRAVEDRHVEILERVKQAVSLPVAVKLSPYFSSFGELALRLDAAGADGLVLFNRFLQPDIDIEAMEVRPGFQLSSPVEGRLPRTWIAALYGKIRASLAATTGVETAEDVIKYLLAGADVVMTTSALVRHGPAYATELLAGLEAYLVSKRIASVADLRGRLAVPADAQADVYERAGYVAALERAKSVYGRLV